MAQGSWPSSCQSWAAPASLTREPLPGPGLSSAPFLHSQLAGCCPAAEMALARPQCHIPNEKNDTGPRSLGGSRMTLPMVTFGDLWGLCLPEFYTQRTHPSECRRNKDIL